MNNEGSISLFDYRNTASIKTDQWYTVRIEIKGAHWKCFLNDELQYEYTYAPKKNIMSYRVMTESEKKLLLNW